MTDRAVTRSIRRRQLDRILSKPEFRSSLTTPRDGWIHEIRSQIGMTAAQLAARIGVRSSTVFKLERTEQHEAISLRSLRKVAEAMDCTLLYAIVPRSSLEQIVQSQAQRRARQIVERVERTMQLESQGSSEEAVAEEVERLAAELARTLSRELWREETES